MDLALVEQLLADRIGLDPSAAGPGLVARAVSTRLETLGLLDADRGRYPAILRHSKAELQALIEEVVVPESWFFRDVRPFAFLTEHVIELFSIGPSLPPFRVLSVPCAGGEEPYSIAMALIDARVAQDWFHIDAADVSEKCLAAARKGVFSANSFRAADLSFRNRHFLKVATGYVLDERIRSCVNFHHHNILDVDFLERAAPYDAIFCRNLLIYFDSSSRKKALDVLDRLLAPTGLLFLGHAEHLGVFGKRFRHVGGRGSFAYARLDAMSAESEPGVTLVPRREMAKSKPAHRVTHRRRIRLSEAINTPQVSSEKGILRVRIRWIAISWRRRLVWPTRASTARRAFSARSTCVAEVRRPPAITSSEWSDRQQATRTKQQHASRRRFTWTRGTKRRCSRSPCSPNGEAITHRPQNFDDAPDAPLVRGTPNDPCEHGDRDGASHERLLEQDRDLGRPELSRAGEVHPLPQLPGVCGSS